MPISVTTKSGASLENTLTAASTDSARSTRAPACSSTNLTQIERFFRACGISCGEAPLFSVSGFVADLLEAIPQSQSRGIGHRAHGRYEQAFSTLSATRVLKSDDRILQRSG